MGRLILFVLLGITAISALIRPWIGVIASYLIIILRPQDIWWWNFQGTRAVFVILLPTIIGFAVNLFQGALNFELIKSKMNLYLMMLWFFLVLSYFFGPYMGTSSSRWWHQPDWTLSIINKIFLLYFMSCFYISSTKRVNYLTLVIVISVIYLIYWTNAQYLVYHHHGRIGGPMGPGGGTYRDENVFAMLFVTGLPFLYYYGWYTQKKYLRYTLWLIIPLGWHAIFLTGSRGGLVGLIVTIVVVALKSKRRLLGLMIIPLFAAAYIWQAGSVMKERARTIEHYRTENSAATRIQAWKAAINMIKAHPITGVGLAAFGVAFPDYSPDQPREAHNTVLQIAAESGIGAGLMYLLVLYSMMKILLWNSRMLSHSDDDYRLLYFINESILTSIIGFFVCSLFLTLILVEIFYLLCLLTNSINYIVVNEYKNILHTTGELRGGLYGNRK